MTTIRNVTLIAATALGATWLLAAHPAQAAGDKSDAREACADKMDDRNFKNTDVGDVNKNKKGNVVVEADATRRGNDRSVECVYNPETEKARIRN
jgi:hypothetical protein